MATIFCSSCGAKLEPKAPPRQAETRVGTAPPSAKRTCTKCGKPTENLVYCDACFERQRQERVAETQRPPVPAPPPQAVKSGVADDVRTGCEAFWWLLGAILIVVFAWPILGPPAMLALATFVVAIIVKAVFSK